jgi:hypothetical protein
MLKIALIVFWMIYFFSPVDIIPDWVPGIGRLDDLLLLIAIYYFTRKRSSEPLFGKKGERGGARPGRGYGAGSGPGSRQGYGRGAGGGAGTGRDWRNAGGTGWSSGSTGSTGSTGSSGTNRGGNGGAYSSSSAGSGGTSGSAGQGANGRGSTSARSEKRDPYSILGINRSATLDDIKHAYRDKAGKYHPDKVTHLGEEFQALAKEKFQDIQWAYETILKEKGER